jgi:hypothetical protein
MKYHVIRDTREQKGQGWSFASSKYCEGTSVSKLDTGDYSLAGYEDVFTIERKGSVTEFAKNITQKRFENELERMKKFVWSFVLLEFDMLDVINYPDGCNIPYAQKKKIKFRGPFFLKRIIDFQLDYPTKIMFVGNNGPAVASSIFKRVVERADSE